MTKIIVIGLILPVLLIGAPAVHPSDEFTTNNADPLITIDILSKHFRLLGEGKTESILFNIPADAAVTINETGESLPPGSITISHDLNFIVSCGQTALLPGQSIHVSSSGNAVFTARISGEKDPRRYPLPLDIEITGQNISCVVTETISRYAVDSASAELGVHNNDSDEAVAALAMIIRARGIAAIKSPMHSTHSQSVFCDLTHCQVYRGRTGTNDKISLPWSISEKSIRSELLFHASCGGHTLCANIFSRGIPSPSGSVHDRLLSDGTFLCRGSGSAWFRDIPLADIDRIIRGDTPSSGTALSRVSYDQNSGMVILHYGENQRSFAAEDFRLRINRVRGWTFIRSNNYTIDSSGDGNVKLRGSGLGHGVGLCQTGALALSRMGFSRYEIIRHYFPGIDFVKNTDRAPSPNLIYCRFTLDSDRKPAPSYTALLKRRIPMGSTFKILVSCYLLTKRPDLTQGHEYICADTSADHNMPDHCVIRRGHGRMSLPEALPHSCNLFFASLYSKIDRDDFMKYISELSRRFSLTVQLPDINTPQEFSTLLSGLDFRATATVNDYIILSRIIHSGTGTNRYLSLHTDILSVESRQKIHDYLRNTYLTGTASTRPIPHDPFINYEGLFENDSDRIKSEGMNMWGKTSSFIHGSNALAEYGAFIGGNGNDGIIVIIRHGNGNLAAWWGQKIIGGGCSFAQNTDLQ